MLSYTVRRVAGIVPILFVLVTMSFFVVRLAPGGPFDQEQGLPVQVRANLERAYGLSEPLPAQYLRYLKGLAHGDFGPSLKLRDFSVNDLIAQGLPVSATLGVMAMLLAVGLGVPLGVAAALYRGAALDHAVAAFVVLGI